MLFSVGVLFGLVAFAPWVLFAKLVLSIVLGRITLAPRGTAGARVEGVLWLLYGALCSHMIASFSDFANDPEDICAEGEVSRIVNTSFFHYPYSAHCEYRDGTAGPELVPWPLNLATALFAVAAVAVAAYPVFKRVHHAAES